MPDVIQEIAAERQRQITVEGFDAVHDNKHNSSRELARAAVAYAQHYFERQWLLGLGNLQTYQGDEEPVCWPWDPEWWKPKTPRQDLVRATALLVAEIERIDSLAEASAKA